MGEKWLQTETKNHTEKLSTPEKKSSNTAKRQLWQQK